MNYIKEILSWANVPVFFGLWAFYYVIVAIYNISPLHPLYRFPGPKIAAASYAYEAYFDWWLVGRYSRKIQQMHKKYGPIIRINPDELHCDDPYFSDEIYAGGNRIRDRWQHQLNTGASSPASITFFSTVSHELHRLRRAPFGRSFSRQRMLKLEGEVHDYAQKTVDKILRAANKGPFDIKEAFNCFTADIISQYAFGEPMGFVDQEGWEPNFATWNKYFLERAYLIRYNTLIRKLAGIPWIVNFLGDRVKKSSEWMTTIIPKYINTALENPEDGRVFADVMESDILPEHEKSMYRLSGEGFMLLLAGTETTAGTLTYIVYYLLARPSIYARLIEDLKGVDPFNLKWIDLEQRPYLWAIIHEALRLTPGGSQRMARIARTEDLIYKDKEDNVQWVIPKGTPIGMTPILNNTDEKLFPNPEEFIPERWLLDGQPNYALEKMLISFGKGSRICLGINLAYCELFIMTTAFAFRVLPRAQLYETTIEDVKYDHDLIVPQTVKGPIAARIKIS
ncbi:cytochrome P450 [Daldinia sp. FL1419]|nr:cytochrome P450 [Daldinia sp. FL1419]